MLSQIGLKVTLNSMPRAKFFPKVWERDTSMFMMGFNSPYFDGMYALETMILSRDDAKNEGIFLSPEGAAATAAYDRLIASGELKPTDKVVLFNTGAGLKYTDMTAEALKLKRPGTLPTSMPVGGIITPV